MHIYQSSTMKTTLSESYKTVIVHVSDEIAELSKTAQTIGDRAAIKHLQRLLTRLVERNNRLTEPTRNS